MALSVSKLRVNDPEADKIKKRKDAILEKIDKRLPQPPFRILINGPSGSGKSSTFKWLLLNHYCGVFDEIFIFCPTFSTDRTLNDLVTYKTIKEVDPSSIPIMPKQRGVGGHSPQGKPYPETSDEYKKAVRYINKKELSPNSCLDPTDIIEESDTMIILHVLEERWNQCKTAVEQAEEKGKVLPRSLFVFDDLSVELANSTILANYFTKGRKYGISIIIMSNKYKTYNPTIRNNCTQFLFFKPTTKMEREAMSADVAGALDAKVIPKLMEKAYQKSGDFMYVDMTAAEPERFRRNFDEPLSLPRGIL